MLELDEVRFAHHGREPVADGLDLTVRRGEVHQLAGPSGCGKSTLLRLAAGLIPRLQGGRLAGSVHLGGQEVSRIPPAELPSRVGWVPQDPEESFAARTVEAELCQLARNLSLEAPREAARGALEELEAEHLLAREVEQLSGGEAARVSLAAAGLGEPEALVLDEPTVQLDRAGRKRAAGWIHRRAREGARVLVAEHAPHPLEPDEVHRLGDGSEAKPEARLPEPESGRALARLDGALERYGDAEVGPFDLGVHPGEVVCLAGPNGSGKTTALHLLAGLLEPDEGRARVLGRPPAELEAPELAAKLGIAFQHPAWHITQDTVADEVAFTGERLGQQVAACERLAEVGLEGYADEHPWDLSGGERQRLACATAHAHEPPVLLLDEPTRGLDPDSRARLAGLLRARVEAGRATIVASHHPWVQELAHRTVSLGGGPP